MQWKHGSKPVIGIVGGIGSGKSAIAAQFAQLGCAIIDSDKLSHEAIESPEIKAELLAWLGDAVFEPQGRVMRKAVGAMVFSDPQKLARLNGLIHPWIAKHRQQEMAQHLANPAIKAIVWDSPLLLETGLNRECDAVVFVRIPNELRAERVAKTRGWTPEELAKREKSQIPLDKKAVIADYYVDNSGDPSASKQQVQQVLSHLFSMSRP